MGLKSDLMAAKALIDAPEKWTKGAFVRSGARCIVGAVDKIVRTKHRSITGRYEARNGMLKALYTALPKSAGDTSLIMYNDAPRRKHEQVVNLFERAITAAES